MTRGIVEEQQPFDVAWRTIDGLRIRYATNGRGGEKVVLFSPWPESIFAFAPVWGGLTKQFEMLAIDLPGFGRSEGRNDLFAPQAMGEFIAKAIDAFGLTSVHAVGLDVGSPSVLFAALARPALFRSLIVGAGASTALAVEGAPVVIATAPPSTPASSPGFGAHSRMRCHLRRDDYLNVPRGDRRAVCGARSRAQGLWLAPRLASIEVPVAIVVGRNDPCSLDAAILRDRLPHARLDVLEAGASGRAGPR